MPGQAHPMPWLAPVIDQALSLRRAHALLLHGAAGDGLYQAARMIGQAWLCEATETFTKAACGRCPACLQVDGDLHADLRQLLPEALRQQLGLQGAGDGTESGGADSDGGSKSRRKPSRQVRIGEVRSAIDWITISSARGRGKVLLIHPAEAMNVAAANALLKTLEEPPATARLLLTASEPDKLLPTVRSRCQVLRLQPPSPADALAWLRHHQIAEPEVMLAACGQRPLDALALAQSGMDAARWTAVPAAVLSGNFNALNGIAPTQMLDALQKLCHDGMALGAGGQARFFPAGSISKYPTMDALSAWSKALSSLAQRIDHPWHEGLLIEAMLQEAHTCWAARAKRSDTLAA